SACIASSCDSPRPRSVAYSSSRCCRISSLIARGHSGMFVSSNPADGLDEIAPRVALRSQHARAGWRQPVVAPPPLARLLDPAALDPAALLQPVEQRVERCDAEAEQATRARFDQLAQVVAMPRLILDERQDQQLGAPLLQLAIEHGRFHMLHSD